MCLRVRVDFEFDFFACRVGFAFRASRFYDLLLECVPFCFLLRLLFSFYILRVLVSFRSCSLCRSLGCGVCLFCFSYLLCLLCVVGFVLLVFCVYVCVGFTYLGFFYFIGLVFVFIVRCSCALAFPFFICWALRLYWFVVRLRIPRGFGVCVYCLFSCCCFRFVGFVFCMCCVCFGFAFFTAACLLCGFVGRCIVCILFDALVLSLLFVVCCVFRPR